jgi:hypothetical protein
MAIWKKTAAYVAITVVVTIGAGYAIAFASLTACADETFSNIQRQGIRGTDMAGKRIDLTRGDVLARVTGPFLVETRYIVPRDFHGSYHFTNYVVLLWWRYERSSDVVYLVMAPSRSQWLSANNSFKPTPLRGAA